MSFSQRSRIYISHSEFEMLHIDCHCFKNLGIDFFSFNINDVHFLSDTLKGRLSTQSCNISTNKTMCFLSNCFKINIFCKFHIFCVDSQNLKSTNLVRDTNINLSIKSAKSSKSRINRIRSISSSNNNNMSSPFKSIHKSQKLRDNSSLNLTINFLSIRSNGVNLINKNNGGALFLSFLKSLPQIAFSLPSHFRHNLRSIN